MRIAAINFKLRPIRHEEEFVAHALELLDAARSDGAELAIFPECFTLELLALHPDVPAEKMAKVIDPTILDPLAAFCRVHEISCIAGTTFFPSEERYLNGALWFDRDGLTAMQPKLVMTQYETNEWQIVPGMKIETMPDARFGVAICYDIEFPEIGRAMAESGNVAIAVPTYTETRHGHHRVRECCRARAIENQIFVAMASLVGSLGREPVPEAVGSSAVFAPCVAPFPADGILAQTPPNEESIAIADLDFEGLIRSRSTGDVRNWEDRLRGAEAARSLGTKE